MKKHALWLMTLLALVSGPHVPDAAAAETLQALQAGLERWDVETLWPGVTEGLSRHPQDAAFLETAAHIAFYRGDYPQARELIQRAVAAGGAQAEQAGRQGFAQLVANTIQVLAPYTRYETAHFIIHLDASQDGILVGYLSDALEKTYRVMDRNYGFRPAEKVRVELFADTKAFYLTSTLSVRDIEVTGAVGLTKFNKLQFLSPRVLVHGYRWLDAISHEYMHYLIVKLTANKAPIWFHEGLSKFEETRWRTGPDYLSALYRTLLANAQADAALIAFERMEPSLVHLDTPEAVQLAYAQSASAIEFIIDRVGHEGLREVMAHMARGETRGAGQAVQEVLGMDFSQFESQWKIHLAAKGLTPVPGVALQRYKVKESRADADQMELSEIKSLVARNRTHLGDRLQARGRANAAVLEYRRALAEARDSVPVLNRLSAVLVHLDRDAAALDVLKQVLALAPDHPAPHTQMGRIALKRKDFALAKVSFEESLQINPFNPEVHAGLADAYAMLGDAAGAAKETDTAHMLRK